LASITRERAERIAKAHGCELCGEYSFKKVLIRPATKSQRADLKIAWMATKVCGICGAEMEMGIGADGDVVYVS
jgi:transcription elongation factor Elf1